jgi:hypothetical protein
MEWRKATASGEGGCVEINITDQTVLVRDSKNRGGPILRYTATEWAAFLHGVKNGEFDL